MTWARLSAILAARAVARPRLAVDLARITWRFRRHAWYRRPPFLPLPAAEYVGWRMYTAYGDEHAVPAPADVVRYARWAAAAKRP